MGSGEVVGRFFMNDAASNLGILEVKLGTFMYIDELNRIKQFNKYNNLL